MMLLASLVRRTGTRNIVLPFLCCLVPLAWLSSGAYRLGFGIVNMENLLGV